MEARDALKKALEEQRRDGSWSTSQPIFLIKRVIGVWPSTPDVGLLLVAAATGRPEITETDEGLFRFVGWLQKNRIDLPGDPTRSGWASGTREEDVIDLWSTSVAVNALIEIRELVEHRLWQLCKKRFVVRGERDLKSLFDIAPVDLGYIHGNRLHHRLARMARETAMEHGNKSDEPKEYAFVLHGPPGSSKTAIAEAIGKECGARRTRASFA